MVWIEQYGAQQLHSSVQTLGFGPEAATALSSDSAGNVVVAGYVGGNFAGFTGDPGVIDAYLTKYSSTGSLMWLQQFPSPNGALLGGVTTDALNNIYTVGAAFTQSSSVAQIFAAKLNANGNPLWYVALPAYVGLSFGEQIKADAEGNVIVAGFGFFGGSSQETLLAAKLSGADGHLLWVQTDGLPAFGLLTAMALDGSGNPLFAALLTAPDGATYPFAAKLNQADGSFAWTHQITTVGNSMIPFSITSDAAGNALVGGGVFDGQLVYGFTADPKERGILYKLGASDGGEQWNKIYSTGKGDSITGVQTIANGTIYATGYTNGQFNFYDTPNPNNTVFFLTLTSDGSLNSAHQFGAGPLANQMVPFGPTTTIDTNGDVFVSGATTNAFPGFTNDAHALQMFIAKLTPGPLLQY